MRPQLFWHMYDKGKIPNEKGNEYPVDDVEKISEIMLLLEESEE